MKKITLLFLILLVTMISSVSAYICDELNPPCSTGNTCDGVTNLTGIFENETDFNTNVGDITGWNTSCIIDMSYMFKNSNFDQDLSGWDLVTSLDYATNMFEGVTLSTPNYDALLNNIGTNWETYQGTGLDHVVFDVGSSQYTFKASSNWNNLVIGLEWTITDGGMLPTCTETNAPCDGTCYYTDLSYMFSEYDFVVDEGSVGDITGWNTSCIIDMTGMFSNSNFDDDLSGWDMSNLQAIENMFEGVTLSTSNYDALLNNIGTNWETYQLVGEMNLVNFDVGGSIYTSDALSNRNNLVIGLEWIITDGGMCVEDWSPLYSSCTVGDNQTLTYEDLNACGTTENLPIDNNTIVSCNYCTVSYSVTNTSETACLSEDRYDVDYTITNTETCCDLTSIPADCIIPDDLEVICPYTIGDYQANELSGAVVDTVVGVGITWIQFAGVIVIVLLGAWAISVWNKP